MTFSSGRPRGQGIKHTRVRRSPSRHLSTVDSKKCEPRKTPSSKSTVDKCLESPPLSLFLCPPTGLTRITGIPERLSGIPPHHQKSSASSKSPTWLRVVPSLNCFYKNKPLSLSLSSWEGVNSQRMLCGLTISHFSRLTPRTMSPGIDLSVSTAIRFHTTTAGADRPGRLSL